VRNEEEFRRVKEERFVLHTVRRRKSNWIGHTLRRNWFIKHVTEEKVEKMIEVRRRKQLLDDIRGKRV
jgi:hypothetical protein